MGQFLWAQDIPQQLAFSHLSVNNGLSQGVNNCILKDSRGFVWISSFDGLNRFDGINCQIYRQNTADSFSIKGTLFLNILEDKKANLWIGSNQGLNFYNRSLNRFINFQMTDRALEDQFFSPFYIDDKNRIWLQSRSDIILFDPALKKFFLKYTYPLSGNLFIKTNTAGLYQPLQEIYTSVNNSPVLNIISIKNNQLELISTFPIGNEKIARINSFIPAGTNKFWLGTNNGLYFFDRGNNHLALVDLNTKAVTNISTLNIDSRGRLWIGTFEQGLYLADTASKKMVNHYYFNSRNPYGLSGKQVLYIYPDPQQYLWVSIWGKGVDYVSLDKFRFSHYLTKEELSDKGLDNFIRSIVQTNKKEIWLASQTSGIIVLNDKKEVLQTINSMLPSTIEHLLKDNTGLIWAATFSGIFTIDAERKKAEKINNPAFKNNLQKSQFNFIYQLQDERLLASSNAGLFLITKQEDKYNFTQIKNSNPSDVFLTSFQDKEGIIYISRAFKGFYSCRLVQDSLVIIKDYPYQASIKCFAETNDSTLWIGSTTGLMKFNKKSRNITEIYTTNNGLNNQYIYGIIPHNEYLWLSSNAGISRLNTLNNEVKNFSSADGLQSNEFNTYSFLKLNSGELLFGGVNGLNAFYPEQLKKDTTIPPISLQIFRINDTSTASIFNAEELHQLDLSYAENTISFQFSVVDFSNPNGCSFLYKLQGYDKEWISSSNNSIIRYANLPPGNYTLSAKAVSAEGLQSNFIYTIAINIKTPWQQSWWFRSLLVLGIAFLLFAIIKSYLQRQFQKHKNIIEKELAIEQERTRMAHELHDGLGSMLSGVKHSFSAMRKNLEMDEIQQLKFHSNIDKLNESIIELRNISHSIPSHNLLQNGLENSLSDYCQNLNQSGEINISFKTIGTKDIILTDEQILHSFRIVQELLNNILKHANATHVIVQLSHNAKHLYINVEDNGKGFELQEAIKNKGMGLKNIESRIKILKAKIDYQTEPMSGTSVMIEIPCKEIKAS